MCQATVYLDGKPIERDVIWLEPTADGILMRTFFGEPKTVQGTLQGIDLLKHRVLLVSRPGASSEEGQAGRQNTKDTLCSDPDINLSS